MYENQYTYITDSKYQFLHIKVSDVEAEYFPPKEDIILQNEAQTDLYILVSGSVVSNKKKPFNSRLKITIFAILLTLRDINAGSNIEH